MINTTDRPILLLDANSLDVEVRAAFSWADKWLIETQKEFKFRSSVRTAYSNFFGEANRRPNLLDQDFVLAAYDFASSDARSTSTQAAMETMALYLKRRAVPATGFGQVKRGIKLALVELWRRGALLLPTVFTLGPRFPMGVIDHELIQWLRSVDPASTEGVQATSYRRLYEYGPRLVLATDWVRVEDVSIVEISMLHHAQRLHSEGLHPHAIAGSQFPWLQLPAELYKRFPDRVPFSQDDLVKYSAWSVRNAAGRAVFENFTLEKKPKKRRRPSKSTRGAAREALSEAFMKDAEDASTHDAVLVYWSRLSKRPSCVDWKLRIPVYPGREHVDIGRIYERWVITFTAFLRHRELIQGYRSSDCVISSLNILADYLFLYLPWWHEMYPQQDLGLPAAPNEFRRYAYVSRLNDEPLEKFPASLLKMLRLRRPKAESAAICIKHLARYFQFVAVHFGDDVTVAGPTFRNPLDDEFDSPRIPTKKNKTNKEIIPRHVYGHLLFYCYAVEEFGLHLLRQALDGRFKGTWAEMRRASRYEASRFGFLPSVRYRSLEMLVRWVPNVFAWVEREVEGGDERVAVTVPHLTALRLLIVAIETGLRCQSVQWLDRETWDSLNVGSDERYIYRLLVNTDKTKVEPWAPPIVFRVRNVLRREVEFQEIFADFAAFEPVLYEGIKTSPFDPVRPLFRSPGTGRPIGDNVYSDVWLALQLAFAEFYKGVSGERHVRLHYLKPLKTPDGQPVVKYEGRNANAYCAVSILPVHTPHSCRATFATNRQSEGILELSDVAELLGHEGRVTTAHYTKFSGEQLQERLQQSDVALLGDYSIFEAGTESAYVRPDKPDSALRQGFSEDREGTVAAFRFMPSMTLWSIEDNKLDERNGLTLLKSGPMSHIRFRETHICPVGEECPADIVRRIGAPKRCGICPLAMKCIDHLPPIAAKRNQLVERIRYLHAQRERMEAAGEPSTAIDGIWDEIQLDINELLGWKFSEEVLSEMHVEAERLGDAAFSIHVGRPDIVRRHLKLVTRQCDRTEFLLQRIAESNAYPSMSSPHVELAASVLRRRLSAGQGLDDLVSLTSESDDVRSAASMLGTLMKAEGLSVRNIARILSAPLQSSATEPLLMHAEARGGE